MSSVVLQTTPHTVGLIPIALRHELTGCQSSKLIYLQTAGEILRLHVQPFTTAFHICTCSLELLE